MTLEDQARNILESVACPETTISRGELARFLSARRSAPEERFRTESVSYLEVTAALWAVVMLERPREAKQVVDTLNFRDAIEGDPTMTTVERARASIVVSAVHLLGADLPQAVRTARLALYYSAEEGAHEEEAVSHSLLAAALALSGHYKAAKSHFGAALESADLRSEEGAEACQQLGLRWPMMLAQLLVGTREGGMEFGSELGQIPLVPSTNSIVGGYRVYQKIIGQMIVGDFLAACSYCEAYRSRPDYEDGVPLFNHLILGSEALCLLQTRRPGGVFSLLEEAVPSPCGFVPYGSLIANAYILLGNPARALEVLAERSHGKTSQCLSAKASTLLREAVAHEMLGDHAAADLAFFQASKLAEAEEGAVPPVGLPLQILEALQSRLAASSPEMVEKLEASSFGKYEQWDARSPLCNCADLTPRELELAEQLAAGKTFNEIADETFRSLNTLKSQSRSLYKKLQVDSREEAISVLRRAGFFT